jgi:hypothetical protein
MKTLMGALLVSLITFSCNKNLENTSITCNEHVVINEDEYANAPNDNLNITSVQLDGDCLTINFTAGGCDGSTWLLKLIDADVIMESYPPQRNLRLSLKNEELCKAIVSKEVTYNISELQLEYDKIKLNITNSGEQILYQY